jgi:predicted nucleic acid-binding protein
MMEYESVLFRDKFPFEPLDVRILLNTIWQIGNIIVPKPIESSFSDQEDRKFYEAAKSVGAYLITGNLRQFPEEAHIVSPTNFIELVGQL